MSRRQRLGVAAAAAVLFAGAFIYAAVSLSPGERRAERAPEAPAERPVVIGEGAEIVLRYVMEQGEEASVEVSRASGELVGLSLGELAAVRPTWRIRSFSPERIVADVPCEPEGDGGFLGERGGRVAIFDGARDGCHRLREVTGISVDRLREEAKEALEDGIPFEGDDDLPQLLEGLLGEV